MPQPSKFNEQRDKVLVAIHKKQINNKKSPSVRGLAEDCGVATATMHSYLTKLFFEGLIEWKPGRHRTLRLTPLGQQAIQQRLSLAARRS